MARLPRKLIGVVVLLVILVNIWMLSKKQLPRNFELSPDAGPSEELVGSPKFDSHQKGEPWNKGSSPGSAEKDSARDGKAGSKENQRQGVDSNKGTSNTAADTSSNPLPFSQVDYDAGMAKIKSVLDVISQITPGVNHFTGTERYNRRIMDDSGMLDNGELPPTSTVLGMYLKVSDEEVETLKKSHAAMMKELPDSLPPRSVTGRGIVMTGGGKYFPMVLTAVRWLRENDKTTPIEVFMADSTEYEPHICDNLFPKINVECRVLREIYGAKLSDKLDSPYALKPLAILASKFDDIYFMDADSYPLSDVNRIFEWSIYKQYGLVLNGDYWPRYISPKFYQVAGIELGGRARGNPKSDALLQSDREHAVPGKSTESGQVFVRKSAHIKSLLLAMYYNLFGPDVYFPLLMQNGHGEGDKDTYAAAAIICNEGYYQTQRRPVTLGQHFEDRSYKGFAMVQPDPIRDYELFEDKRDDLKESFFALHANSIKSNIKYLLQGYDEPIRGAPPLRKSRFFGNMDNVRHELLEDNDVEVRLFRTMEEVVCEWAIADGYQPRDWDGEDLHRYCRILKKHGKWLKEHTDELASHDAEFYIDIE